MVRFLEESSLLDEEVATIAGARKVLRRARRPRASPSTPRCSRTRDELLVVKAIERKSGLARTHRLPAALFEHHDYRKFAEVHAALLKQVGRPPFEVTLRRAAATTRSPSRRCAARCSSSPATASS